MSLHLEIYIITITIWLLCMSTSTDIVSGHATDTSRSSSRNDDSLGIHQHSEGWSEVTNENEVSGEVDSLIDGIQSSIEQTKTSMYYIIKY
jgi:hypothetical protein